MFPYGLAEDDEDQKLKTALTPGAIQQAPTPMPSPSPMAAPAAPNVALAPQMPPAAPTPSAVKPARLPGMPEGVGPSDIEPYLAQQKQSLSKYGPEAQMDLERQTLADRDSFRNRLTSGVKGFADAIMQGVAEKGNPGWQNQFENQQDARAGEQMNVLRGANESNLKRTEATMSLDKMDPKSELSKSAQASYAPLFGKLGYAPEAIKGMSAANIESALQLMTAYGGKEIEAMIKQYDLEIEKARLQAMVGNQQANQKQEALKQVANMPWYSHITNRPALKEMKKEAGLSEDENEQTITIQSSDGGTHTIFANKLDAAKQRDPNLKVIQ